MALEHTFFYFSFSFISVFAFLFFIILRLQFFFCSSSPPVLLWRAENRACICICWTGVLNEIRCKKMSTCSFFMIHMTRERRFAAEMDDKCQPLFIEASQGTPKSWLPVYWFTVVGSRKRWLLSLKFYDLKYPNPNLIFHPLASCCRLH